jgi:hypothetical protein
MVETRRWYNNDDFEQSTKVHSRKRNGRKQDGGEEDMVRELRPKMGLIYALFTGSSMPNFKKTIQLYCRMVV